MLINKHCCGHGLPLYIIVCQLTVLVAQWLVHFTKIQKIVGLISI